MNQTFSFQRFSLLVAKHWAENRKRYLLSILAFISLIFVWFLFIMLTDSSHPLASGLQEVTFVFTLFLIGPFYASQYFNELSSKTKGTNYLMVPASVLEKLLCSVLYSIVLFFIVFTIAFYFVDFLAILTANIAHPSYNATQLPDGRNLKAVATNVFNMRAGGADQQNMSYYFISIFLAVQSAALLGSIYFNKYSYIKTAISLALIFLMVAFLEVKVLMSFMPKGHYWGTGFEIYEDGTKKIVLLPGWTKTVLGLLLFNAFPIIFWVTTYFRLKEKEV